MTDAGLERAGSWGHAGQRQRTRTCLKNWEISILCLQRPLASCVETLSLVLANCRPQGPASFRARGYWDDSLLGSLPTSVKMPRGIPRPGATAGEVAMGGEPPAPGPSSGSPSRLSAAGTWACHFSAVTLKSPALSGRSSSTEEGKDGFPGWVYVASFQISAASLPRDKA